MNKQTSNITNMKSYPKEIQSKQDHINDLYNKMTSLRKGHSLMPIIFLNEEEEEALKTHNPQTHKLLIDQGILHISKPLPNPFVTK